MQRRPVLPDHAELSTRDFEPSDSAYARMLAAEASEVCGVEPLEASWSQGQTLTWLERYRPALAQEFKDGVIAQTEDAEREDHIWYGGDNVDTQTRRLRWDTRTEPTVAVDVEVLDTVARRSAPEQWLFLEDRLALTACAECRQAGSGGESPSAFALSRYLAIHFDGNLKAAEAQSSWQLARSIFDLLENVEAGAREAG